MSHINTEVLAAAEHGLPIIVAPERSQLKRHVLPILSDVELSRLDTATVREGGRC